MAKQIYIDSNGNEIQVSGTVNTADMMPMSGNDSTKVSTAIGDLSNLTTSVTSSLVGAVNEVNADLQNAYKETSVTLTGTYGQYVSNLDWSDYHILQAWVTGYGYLVIVRPSGTGKAVFNVYTYDTNDHSFKECTTSPLTINFGYIDLP